LATFVTSAKRLSFIENDKIEPCLGRKGERRKKKKKSSFAKILSRGRLTLPK